MATQINRVLKTLRDKILSGEIAQGSRIVELEYTALLDVSRTPLRIALSELEKEGLVERREKRGYQVRQFSEDSLKDVMQVRGALEALAVQLLAEQGTTNEVMHKLESNIKESRKILLDTDQSHDLKKKFIQWSLFNKEFHTIIISACNNTTLELAYSQYIHKIPLTSPGTLAHSDANPEQELAFILRAQQDHEDIVYAIKHKQSSRAQALMKEHIERSLNNKKALLKLLDVAPSQGV